MKNRIFTNIAIEEFDEQETIKSSGATLGFIKQISDANNQGTYMFKPIAKSDEAIDNEDSKHQQSPSIQKVERGNALMEYIFSGVFQTVLKDQSPIIGLAVDRKNKVFMTSKFLDTFIHINNFCEDNRQKLANGEIKIEGLEIVVIASLYCGDTDLNHGNIGVTTKLEDGVTKYTAAKIDYGAAGVIDEHKDLGYMLKTYYLNNYKYAKELPFDLTKTQEATSIILGTIDAQKESIITAINNLSTQNIDLNFTNLYFDKQECTSSIQYLDVRQEKLQEFDTQLSQVATIKHQNPKWKTSGAWTEALTNGSEHYMQNQIAQDTGNRIRSVLSNNVNTTKDIPSPDLTPRQTRRNSLTRGRGL